MRAEGKYRLVKKEEKKTGVIITNEDVYKDMDGNTVYVLHPIHLRDDYYVVHEDNLLATDD